MKKIIIFLYTVLTSICTSIFITLPILFFNYLYYEKDLILGYAIYGAVLSFVCIAFYFNFSKFIKSEMDKGE